MRVSSNHSDTLNILSNPSRRKKQELISKTDNKYIGTKGAFSKDKKPNKSSLKDNDKLKMIQDLLSTYRQKEGQRNINPSLQMYLNRSTDGYEKICEVCLNSSECENDVVVQCSICLEYTHQSCYGSELINRILTQEEKKDWSCSRCNEILKAKFKEDEFKSYLNKICCLFCPKYTGITKKITEFFWAHITCVNWIPDIYFQDNYCESVNLKQVKWTEKKCYICKLSIGLTIKCEYGNCNKYFHVTCGINVGSLYDCDLMKKQSSIIKNEEYKKVYCANHTLEYFKKNSNFILIPKSIQSSEKKPSSELIDKYPINQDFSKRKRIPLKLKKMKAINIIIHKEQISLKEKRTKKRKTLERYEGNLNKSSDSECTSLNENKFTNIEKKFYSLIENDMKRINENKDSILSISTFNKLKEFVKQYVEKTNFHS